MLDGKDNIPFPPLGSLQFNPVAPTTPVHGDRLLKLLEHFELNSIKERWLNGTLWKEHSIGRRLGK